MVPGSVIKKAQQSLLNLRMLNKLFLAPKTLRNIYRCTMESIQLGCITAWYGNYTARNRRALQRVVRSTQHITGETLPAFQDIYNTQCRRKVQEDHQGP